MKLEERNAMKRKKPKFTRQDTSKDRIKNNWRKPRGIDSKMRLQLKGYKKIVKIGYGSPKEFKGMNKKGLIEVLVSNVEDLKNIKENMVALIKKGVGARKIMAIMEEAKKLNIAIANYDESFGKKIEDKQKANKEAKKKKQEKVKKSETKKEDKKETKEVKEEKNEAEVKKEKDKMLTKKGAI